MVAEESCQICAGFACGVEGAIGTLVTVPDRDTGLGSHLRLVGCVILLASLPACGRDQAARRAGFWQ